MLVSASASPAVASVIQVFSSGIRPTAEPEAHFHLGKHLFEQLLPRGPFDLADGKLRYIREQNDNRSSLLAFMPGTQLDFSISICTVNGARHDLRPPQVNYIPRTA